MSKTSISISSPPFTSNFLTSPLPFKYRYKPSMLIFCTSAFLIKFDGSSSMVTSRNCSIIIKFYYNCTMPTCCTFALLVRFDFNSSMVTSFSFTFSVIFDCNPSMTTSYIGLLSSILSLKTFELELDLSRKHQNSFRRASSSRNECWEKWYKTKKSYELYWGLPKCLWMYCNFLKRKCAHNWGESTKYEL